MASIRVTSTTLLGPFHQRWRIFLCNVSFKEIRFSFLVLCCTASADGEWQKEYYSYVAISPSLLGEPSYFSSLLLEYNVYEEFFLLFGCLPAMAAFHNTFLVMGFLEVRIISLFEAHYMSMYACFSEQLNPAFPRQRRMKSSQ